MRVEALTAMTVSRSDHPNDRARSRRARVSDEAGFTVIEMLVASFVLGIGVVGVAALLITSARTTSLAETQSDASALARSELEIVRSFDYDDVGIATTADGFVSKFDGRPTVTESAGNLVEARGKVEVAETIFGIQRSVTWATVGRDERAYKIVVVIVEWETPAGPRTLQVQTGLHEGLTDA